MPSSYLSRMRELSRTPRGISELTDISNLPVDPSLPPEERIGRFVQSVGNPYQFRVGDTAVRVHFSEGGPTLGAQLLNAAKNGRL